MRWVKNFIVIICMCVSLVKAVPMQGENSKSQAEEPGKSKKDTPGVSDSNKPLRINEPTEITETPVEPENKAKEDKKKKIVSFKDPINIKPSAAKTPKGRSLCTWCKTTKEVAVATPEPTPILGIFFATGNAYTTLTCQASCRVNFGYINPTPDKRLRLTKMNLLGDGKECRCLLNFKRVIAFLIEMKKKPEDFLRLVKESFCQGRVWLEQNGVNVEIPYEGEASRMQRNIAQTSSPSTSTGTSNDPKIVVGAFTAIGTDFTTDTCRGFCRTAFGSIVFSSGERRGFAEPTVTTDGKMCGCLLNTLSIQFFLRTALPNYAEQFEESKTSYCAGKVWLEEKAIKVEVEYEAAAHAKTKQNGPTDESKDKAGPSKNPTRTENDAVSHSGPAENTKKP